MTVSEFGYRISQAQAEFESYISQMDILCLVVICIMGLVIGIIAFTTYLEMKE